jgi:SAM-dependent methyltransferase
LLPTPAWVVADRWQPMNETNPARRSDTPSPIRLPVDDTLAGYDRWSAAYDDTKNPMILAAAWALHRQPLPVLAADVLELGCGTGRHAPLLLAGGARSYTGVDGSSGMLRIAERRCRDPRVRWVHGAFGAAALPPGAFDIVLIVLVLEHLQDLRPLLATAATCLRPGGSLRIVDIHPDLVARGTGAHFVDGRDELHFTSFVHALATLEQLAATAGFVVQRRTEHSADGELLAAVPRLAKHAPLPVLFDLEARRG